MQFSTQRRDILNALQTVIGVVEKRQTMPILSNVLIQGRDNLLTITATDLELELVTQCPAAIEKPGEIAVPARKLLDICRGLPDEANIEFHQNVNQTQIKSGRSRFTLTGLAPQDWPHFDEIASGQNLDVPESVIKKLLDRTSFAMAQQDVRYYLNGLLLLMRKDLIRCVATDGHRLALSETPIELEIAEPLQVIIPRKAITELVRLLDDEEGEISLSISDKHLRIRLAGLSFTTKLIDGRFPDYERVIPDNPEHRMQAHRETIRQALSRTAILSNEKFRGVRLSLLENMLKLQSENTEREEAEDEIEVSYNGDPFEIGFNINYLLDALGAMEADEFHLSLSGPDSSGLLRALDDPHSCYVVMPMRL